MDAIEVRTEALSPMRVAVALGFGPSPEMLAWEALLDWARARGALDQTPPPRYFGFNNPNPSPGSPNYGYEQWLTVGPAAQPAGDITLKDVPGGTYLVTRCRLGNITAAWQALVAWAEDNGRQLTHGYCLEECLGTPTDGFDEETVFDLYLPVVG